MTVASIGDRILGPPRSATSQPRELEGSNFRQRLVRGPHDRVGVDVEFLINVGDLAGGTEAVHANEAAFEAYIALPA
jgi:hypothetical protein